MHLTKLTAPWALAATSQNLQPLPCTPLSVSRVFRGAFVSAPPSREHLLRHSSRSSCSRIINCSRRHIMASHWTSLHSSSNEYDQPNYSDFDPLLSPHAYPNGIDSGAVDMDSFGGSSDVSSFGFDTRGQSASSNIETGSDVTGSKATTSVEVEEFDPLLSPHSYPNGIDSGAVLSLSEAASLVSSTSKSTSYESSSNASNKNESSGEDEPPCDVLDVFDPLLSPHAYPNGIPSVPSECFDASQTNEATNAAAPSNQKLGILLIDHGSKRQASNDHLHAIADMYATRVNSSNDGNNLQNSNSGRDTSVVRAAHMEIAEPSILTSLRQLLKEDQVDKVVCVPYFLSPGRHATVDVPNLIEEAVGVLTEEGHFCYLSEGESILNDRKGVQVLVSKALGSHLEGMLGAVGDLVEKTLK